MKIGWLKKASFFLKEKKITKPFDEKHLGELQKS